MLAAVLAVALSQWGPEPSPGMQQYDPGSVCQRTGGRCFLNRSGNRPRENYAFFEFAPASGAGMGTACACTAVTSAKGDAITVARTGSATCSKQGLATTGLQVGDFVSCSSNDQPRVEAQSDGVLSLRVEAGSTNLLPRSEAVDNAVWVKEQDSAPRTPTVTADQSTSPVAGTTADRVQFPATAGVEYSDFYQATTTSLTTGWSCSVLVRGFSGSGTLDVCGFNGTGGWVCSPCAFNATTWVQCSQSRSTTSGVSSFCKVGNNSLQNGGIARSASDVLVVALQGEERPEPTSYIPTVAAAVTRNAEVPSVAGVSLAGLASSGCARAYVARPTGATNGTAVSFSDSNGRPLYYTPGNQTVFDGLNNPSLATTFNASAKWYITRWTGSTFTLHNQDTASANTAFDTSMGVTGPLQIGFSATNLQLDGLISRVQVDPDPTRCSP